MKKDPPQTSQLDFGDYSAEPAPATPKAYTVTEIVRQASRRLEARFGDIWVEGEVSNLRRPRSGHAYFTLKDDGAQLQVVMFRSTVGRLKFQLEDGQQLRCRGKLGIYEVQGRFQLTAVAAEPTGVGALQLAFEQLKRKLSAEGLFDPRHKKELPPYPRTIAVVTSPTGAAVRDIIRVLDRRWPVRVVVCPTAVQGSAAPRQIAEALGRADGLGADLIIVGRGGGSLEDLWAFNEEVVARAIFAVRTPLISAVGHEVDITIADLVADRRAPTPSAAAEIAVPVLAEVRQELRASQDKLHRSMRHRLDARALVLERLRGKLGTPGGLLNRSRMLLDEVTSKLEAAMARGLSRRRELHGRLRADLGVQEPRLRLSRDRASLLGQVSRLRSLVRRGLDRRQAALTNNLARLEALSPLAVLERGYAVVLDQNRDLVRDPARLEKGDPVVVRLHQGRLGCTVDHIEVDED